MPHTGVHSSPRMPKAAPPTAHCPGLRRVSCALPAPHLRDGGCLLPLTLLRKAILYPHSSGSLPSRLDQVTGPVVFPYKALQSARSSPFACLVSWAKSSALRSTAPALLCSTQKMSQLALCSFPCLCLHQFPGSWKQFPASTPFQLNSPVGRGVW